MALKAGGMRVESRRNSHCHATSRWSMTACTRHTALTQMSRMVKLHIEAA
jgi:hypothetical protein